MHSQFQSGRVQIVRIIGELEKNIDAQRANLDLLPKSVQELRVVKVEEFDVCPCAGTHVRSLDEIGKIKITKRENKGKDRERISYELVK